MKSYAAVIGLTAIFLIVPAGRTQQSCSQCVTPDSETSNGTRWAVDPGYDYAYDFVQHLVLNPITSIDNGAQITEAENVTGTDSCYVDGFAVGPYTSVQQGSWTVGYADPTNPDGSVAIVGTNQWGPDIVGFTAATAKYYQVNDAKLDKLPCGTHWYQNLTILCQGDTEITFAFNVDLISTIYADGVTICREGACSPKKSF